MPPRRKNSGEVFQSVRGTKNEHKGVLDRLGAVGLCELILGCVTESMALYVRKTKNGDILVRIYDDEDRYEELFRVDETLAEECESVLESLTSQVKVGEMRRLFASGGDQRAAKARNGGNPTSGTQE